jgi:nicotinamide riboside kinase
MSKSGQSKLVCVIGAPSSGKSTLATSVHHSLKVRGENSIFVGEAATDYIAEWGIPDTPLDQIVIFYKQLAREKMYQDTKDWIICDSSTILNYFYFRSFFKDKLGRKDIAVINHIQKEILKTLDQWHRIYYVPPIQTKEIEDGIRFHNTKEIEKLDSIIKSYLMMEKIEFVDLSSVDIKDRSNYIINDLLIK